MDSFVRRILKEKGLSLSEVERRARGSISDSYVAEITTGNVKNLTLEKLKALARGLGVAEDRLIAIASGNSISEDSSFRESDFAHLFQKYKDLSDEDKQEVQSLIEMLDRELERRQMTRVRA